MVISKYHEHNKPTLTLESIKSSEPIKRSEPVKKLEFRVNKDTISHYESEKINDAFNDNYILIEQYLVKIRSYLDNMVD